MPEIDPDAGVEPTFGFHEIFHALVIAAAAPQYVAVIGWVLPAAHVQ
jgi:predicted membrane channel-forming protein YqfA (hemolysin III family)